MMWIPEKNILIYTFYEYNDFVKTCVQDIYNHHTETLYHKGLFLFWTCNRVTLYKYMIYMT